MSDVTLTQTIESDMPLSEELVKNALRQALATQFDKFKFNHANPNQFSCRVKTKLFNPIVSLTGNMQTQIQENKARIMVDAATKTNGWFWFTILFSFFFPPGFLLDIWLYTSQKKKSIEAFNQALKQIEFQLGKL